MQLALKRHLSDRKSINIARRNTIFITHCNERLRTYQNHSAVRTRQQNRLTVIQLLMVSSSPSLARSIIWKQQCYVSSSPSKEMPRAGRGCIIWQAILWPNWMFWLANFWSGFYSTDHYHGNGPYGPLPLPEVSLRPRKQCHIINYLLTRIAWAVHILLTSARAVLGEYRPEVLTVRTECSKARTKKTSGLYSPSTVSSKLG